MKRFWPLLSACAFLACGGETTSQQGSSGAGTGGSATTGGTSGAGTGGSAATGGTSGAGTSSGGASGSAGSAVGGAGTGGGSSCPSTPPSDGSPCSFNPPGGIYSPVANCSYGDDPRPACRTLALCTQGAWKVTPPPATCSTPPMPPACPATTPTIGDTCSDTSLDCWYPDGTECWCVACKNGQEYPLCQTADPPQWGCGVPTSGCPNPLPQAGAPCTSADPATCGTTCEHPISCQGGAWIYEGALCPICASPDTPIATPEGDKPIAELRAGDLVYSVDRGAIVAVPLVRVGSTRVEAHRVVRVLLDDGGVLEVSPGHPTADGRHFSDLVAGASLDERHSVVSAELVPYRFERTYDVLPASSTGTYFAAGALIGSTLFRERLP